MSDEKKPLHKSRTQMSQGALGMGLVLLKEGDPCPHCKIGKITRNANGDLECNLCGYGRVPRKC